MDGAQVVGQNKHLAVSYVPIQELKPAPRNARTHVAVRRWQTFTGQKATLEDGRTFDEVAERLAETADATT